MSDQWASAIALLMCLVLALSGWRGAQMNWNKTLQYAVIWAAIIMGLAALIAFYRYVSDISHLT